MTHLLFGCGLLLLLVSSATAAFSISFSSSTYYSTVATLEDPIGKVIVKPELVYNDSLVMTFNTKDYSLYRSDSRYFSIDKNGTVRLKAALPYRRLYIFQISMLYTVTLEANETTSGFLTADVRVQAIGPVHFDNTTYRIVVPTSVQVYETVHNFRQHIVYNRSAFRSVYFEFDYVYSSYFSIDATSGDLYLRRTLYPGTFSVRIEIEYDVTLKNGTVFSDDDYVYATVVAIGCRGEEEIKALWPETYPCSAFTVPCGDMDNGQYFTGGYATRVCNAEGDWMPPDYSNCKVKGNAGSFAIIWMTFSTTSGSYVLSQLERIKEDIEDLFPSGAVSNTAPVSAFRSNVQYGFMIGFTMRVASSRLSESSIRSAQLRLSVAYRFGSLYLRSSRTIQGRGLRVFNATAASQCDAEPAYSNSQYLQVCTGKNCNCSNTTINSNGSCTDVVLRQKDEDNPTPLPRNTTGPSYLSLNASDYYGKISAFSPIGTYILTVGYNITGNSVANITNFYYDLSGYYSDYFKIDRKKGHLTVNDDLSSRTYSFDVSFFYTVTYTNGSVGHNYTESDIYITAYAGIGFNISTHYINMDTDYVINVTVLATMSDFLTYDENFVLNSMTFYYISDRRFSVDRDTGEIKIIAKLDPLRLHYARVYLRYNGTINTTNKPYSSSTSILVRIYTLGCFEMENGNVVWPPSHICTTVVHKCEDIDNAFNPGGKVTRYCTSNGTWLDADYSQCSFKPGTNPFVHLYLTFYTGSSSHILRNLPNIIRTAGGLLSQLSATSLTPYSIKDSVVRYGMVVVLRGEVIPNDTILTSINSTIDKSTTFARIRLQTVGNGIEGFKTSGNCEYPIHPSNAQNFSTFTEVCRAGGGVTCDCPVINNTVGLCPTPPIIPTPSITSTQSTQSTQSPTTSPRMLTVAAPTITNTSVELQWSDNTMGITKYKVEYRAVIYYKTSDGDSSYIDSFEITTSNTSYVFTMLTPSTKYTFTVTSYTKNGKSSNKDVTQITMNGRAENPSFVELRFTTQMDCTKWEKGNDLMKQVIDAIAKGISIYCECQYSSQYIKQWNVKCRRNSDGDSDVIVTAQLMPTNLYPAALLMDAMSRWVLDNAVPTIIIDDAVIRIDKDCKVQMDHPYGMDCAEAAAQQAPSTGAVSGNNDDDDDDDDNSAGAAVGGVIAGLVIICVTIVVLVIVVMLLRRREKKEASKPEIPSSSYSADTMKVQLADDF